MPQNAIKRTFLTVSQAARRLDKSERTIINYINEGTLYAEQFDPGKPRSDWMISLDSVERYERDHKDD